ncbi:MAG: hypothetical protein R3231_08245, partial [bacterium]|nr:hypothetical protein [bacterium]
AVPLLVIRIPTDYFVRRKRHPGAWKAQHPLIRTAVLIGKNLLGLLFLATGVVLLFLPGQGLVMGLIGIMLMDFPGKFGLERWIIRQKSVLGTVNWLRTRAGREALEIPERLSKKDRLETAGVAQDGEQKKNG